LPAFSIIPVSFCQFCHLLTVEHFYLLACVEDQKLPKKGALRCSTSFSDHSKARSTTNPKLAFQAQIPPTAGRSFRFAKNGFPEKPEFALRASLFPVISASPSAASGKI